MRLSRRRRSCPAGNFNPRTPCGVRQARRPHENDTTSISIHAPLAGCDTIRILFFREFFQFQSTHPLRGATRALALNRALRRYFNPRTPCGVRPADVRIAFQVHGISIHAPLAGCDDLRRVRSGRVHISIHAPLAGCDEPPRRARRRLKTDFNPRTPCGVRLDIGALYITDDGFQSTHPLRGATRTRWPDADCKRHFNPRTPCGVRPGQKYVKLGGNGEISIHAPLAGCDSASSPIINASPYFNPRTPCGVRHGIPGFRCAGAAYFNPRTPCGVRPGAFHQRLPARTDFNPRTPCGVRQQNCRNIPGKFAQKLQNFCKAEQRAALPRVGQRESGRYFRPCAVRTSRGKPERFQFASDNERALRSVARLCAEVLDAGFILVSKVIKA